jgi:hypothetical protein
VGQYSNNNTVSSLITNFKQFDKNLMIPILQIF